MTIPDIEEDKSGSEDISAEVSYWFYSMVFCMWWVIQGKIMKKSNTLNAQTRTHQRCAKSEVRNCLTIPILFQS